MGLMSKALANTEREKENQILAEAADLRIAAEAGQISEKKKP